MAKVGTRVRVMSLDMSEDWGLGIITVIEPLKIKKTGEVLSQHYPSRIELDDGRITEGLRCWWREVFSILEIPKIGEIFELTLGVHADPDKMAWNAGYNRLEVRVGGGSGNLVYKGKGVVAEQHTRQFMLAVPRGMDVTPARAFNIPAELELGTPEGQWLESFRAKYLRPDGKGPIGVFDDSWTDEAGKRRFPCAGGVRTWISGFAIARRSFYGWRLLYEVISQS